MPASSSQHARSLLALELACVLGLATLTARHAAVALAHDDLFFHIRTGELVLNEGRVPRTDSFSHTLPGAPWTSHEWGFGVLCHLVQRAFGDWGLVHLTQLLAVLVLASLYVTMRRIARPSRRWALPWLLLPWLWAVAEPLFILRAALLSTLGMGVLSYLLVRRHEAPSWRWELGIVALVAAWANVHVGVVYGLALLGLHALQVAFDDLRAARTGARFAALAEGRSLRALGLVAACSAASLTNANGFDLWRFPFDVDRLLFRSGLRWNLGHFGAPTLASFPGFFALVALLLACCLPLRTLRERITRPATLALTFAAGSALFMSMSIRFSRAIPDLAMFALPLCAALFAGRGAAPDGEAPLAKTREGGETGRSEEVVSAVFPSRRLPVISPPALAQLGCLLVLGVAIARAPAFPARALAVSVPVGAAAFLERERLDGPMFNYEAFGGYLGYRLRKPVYWDGRNDVFLPLAIEFAHAPSFAALVRSHGLTLAVLNPGYHQRFGPELARPPLSFGLVYFDAISAIHVARTPQHAALLARAEYRHLRPFAVPSDADLARAAAEPRLLAEVEREARRLLAQGGDAFVAHYVLGGLLHARGKLAEAARELELAQRLAPDDARLLYKRALIARASGREREAGALLERAMAIAAP